MPVTPRDLFAQLQETSSSSRYYAILRESLVQADAPEHAADAPTRIGFIGLVIGERAAISDKTMITTAGDKAWQQLMAAPKTMPEAFAARFLEFAAFGSPHVSAAVGWEALRRAASISAHPQERAQLLPIAERQFIGNTQAWSVARQLSLRNEALLHSGGSLASSFTDQARKALVLLATQGHAAIKRANTAMPA